MSEYEMATLFYQILEAAHAALANFLTVVFAVLVVSYFAADKLDRAARIFLLGVYSLFAVGMTSEIVSLYSDLARLGAVIAQFGGTVNDAFSWHGMVVASASGPRWSIPVTIASICVLAYLGSLVIFYRVKKSGSPGIT